MNRREMLKLAGAVVAAGVPVPHARAQAKRPKRVIVAGAGIGGLCCAYELMKRGHEVVVLEAAGRSGGHVRTIRDPLADGLYADAGAEHFTQPGYDRYWHYVREFKLPALAYPRRDRMLRRIRGKLYTDEMLADRSVLSEFGLNQREIEYLARHPWWNLPMLYFAPYTDSFESEYRPFGVGLDHLDEMTVTDLLKKDGATAAAIEFIGDSQGSALHAVWHAAILKLRGVPLWPPKVFRIRGGNQILTDTFAARLGGRLRLGCPVTGIEHRATGVTVRYREFGRDQKMDADYLVSCISPAMLRKIPVTPDWSEARGFIVHRLPFYTMSRAIFQARTPFWKRDGVSPNMETGDPSLFEVWSMAEEVDTSRGLLVGNASANTSPEDALASFRKVYPGKSDDIEQALVVDWARDPWAHACETVRYAPGWLKKIWPTVIEPYGRIHFAGAYADNLNWGMEAATRSANRVAEAIDAA